MSVQKSVDRLSLSRREEAFERQFLRRLQSWNRQSLWPGIILCAVLTWLAWVVSRLPFHPFTLASGQHPIGVAALALAFGLMVGNALPSTIYFKRGTDIVIRREGKEEVLPFRNPPHVHQPLIQTAVNQLLGKGICESTAESGARTAWVMDQCLKHYYG